MPDDPTLSVARSSTTSNPASQQQQSPQLYTSFIPNQPLNDKGTSSANKAPVTSRALQSSVVFSSGTAQDSFNTAENQTTTHTAQQQQPNRRISSAFSSSINLANPSMASGSASSVPVAAKPTGAIPASSPATYSQQETGGTVSSGARISRLLASSIVFADPTLGSA